MNPSVENSVQTLDFYLLSLQIAQTWFCSKEISSSVCLGFYYSTYVHVYIYLIFKLLSYLSLQ